jgi:hypothetical protein
MAGDEHATKNSWSTNPAGRGACSTATNPGDDGSVGIGPCTVGTHATRLLLVGRPIVGRAEVDVAARAASENDRHTTIPTTTRVGLVSVTTGETHYHLPAAACRRGAGAGRGLHQEAPLVPIACSW